MTKEATVPELGMDEADVPQLGMDEADVPRLVRARLT